MVFPPRFSRRGGEKRGYRVSGLGSEAASGRLRIFPGRLPKRSRLVYPITPPGYVYDTESSLYYLQSRYYNAYVGRFLNADALVATGQGFLGNNMFAYCGNSPVSFADPQGTFWWPLILQIITIPIILSSCTDERTDIPEGYIQENSAEHNCYSYAFGLPKAANPGMYSISEDPNDYMGGVEGKEFYTLDEIQDYVLRDLAFWGIQARPAESPADKKQNEYIVAMKISDMIVYGMSCADVHFAVLLDNGTWADKQGNTPSSWGVIDGYAATWDLEPRDGYYNSDTRYFAVRK